MTDINALIEDVAKAIWDAVDEPIIDVKNHPILMAEARAAILAVLRGIRDTDTAIIDALIRKVEND
jgi:hypothetical protein